MNTAITFLLLLSTAICLPWHKFTDYQPEAQLSELKENIKTDFFDNRIDHFNLTSTDTFKQKYWHIDDYFDKEKGAAILYVQGEAPGNIVGDRGIPLDLAKELKAKLFALQHRFYGTSQPCKDWSLECLRLLNHHQAMADMANFIENKTREMGDPNRKWLVIGGSYAGALVAWFKSKYPHLATVTYSSSGVVNIISDFRNYMHQIEKDLQKDPRCYTAVSDLNVYASNVMQQGSEEEKMKLKSAMGASMLDDLDFLMYFTDMYVGEIQYSTRKRICQKIIKIVDEEKNMLKRAELYAQLGRSIGNTPEDYTLHKERDIRIDVTSSSRQWMYQVCTSYGWFQTGDTNNPMRGPRLNIDYWKKACKIIFGTDVFPDDSYTNGILGDLRIPPLLKQTIMVNGGDDPWQWAGCRDEKLTNDDLLVMIVKCDDCAHCIDLYTPKPTDPKELTEARQIIRKRIMYWMKGEKNDLHTTNADQ